jgi:hypothetical protein
MAQLRKSASAGVAVRIIAGLGRLICASRSIESGDFSYVAGYAKARNSPD